jgi:hypothetical protein
MYAEALGVDHMFKCFQLLNAIHKIEPFDRG